MSTSSQTGCILHRKAGMFPPTELLQKILDANPTGWGAATVSDVDGTKVLEINGVDETLTIEELQDTLKTFENQDITFYFCNSPTAVSTKDMSPYVLVCKPAEEDPEQEDVQLVAFIRGNFPGHLKAGSSHPPEYHLVVDVLLPKFEGLYEMVDGDLDKLMLNLMKPHFKKEILLNSVSEGTITLVAANGVSVSFHQGETQVEGEWGWASDGYGYGVKAAEPEKPAKRGMFKSTTREKAAAPEKIAEAIKPATAETAVKALSVNGYTVRKWFPLMSYSRREKTNAYKMRIGYRPVGWENCIPVDVWYDPQGKIMTFAQVKSLGPTSLGVQQLAKNPPREKDVEPDAVEAKEALAATSAGPAVTTKIQPIMSPRSREDVNNVRNRDGYKKIISERAEVISDPKQAEGYETKFVDFAKQMGATSMEEFACWDFEMRYDLAKTNPLAAAVMLDTLSNICIRSGYFKGKTTEGKTAETVVTAPPKKQGMFKRASAA